MHMDIGIPDTDRARVAEGLSAVLADTYTLYLKTHAFHWNVTGPQFRALHTLFEEQYNEMWQAVDLVAERIRALGHPAPGSFAALGRLSSIGETDEVPKANDMVRLLMEGHETLLHTLRRVLPVAEQGKDQATVDLLTQRMRIHEKTAWMLRSLLES